MKLPPVRDICLLLLSLQWWLNDLLNMICKSLFILPPHDDEEDTRERTCGAIKISTAVIILIVYIRLLDELCDILFFRDLSFITLWEFNL